MIPRALRVPRCPEKGCYVKRAFIPPMLLGNPLTLTALEEGGVAIRRREVIMMIKRRSQYAWADLF
jgi:hypothetical protein